MSRLTPKVFGTTTFICEDLPVLSLAAYTFIQEDSKDLANVSKNIIIFIFCSFGGLGKQKTVNSTGDQLLIFLDRSVRYKSVHFRSFGPSYWAHSACHLDSRQSCSDLTHGSWYWKMTHIFIEKVTVLVSYLWFLTVSPWAISSSILSKNDRFLYRRFSINLRCN